MIRTLLAYARTLLARLHRTRGYQGATLAYGAELRQLATEPGWLNPEEEARTARLYADELVTGRYVSRLENIERVVTNRLDRLWLQTCATLHLDPIDIEWAILASGELITV